MPLQEMTDQASGIAMAGVGNGHASRGSDDGARAATHVPRVGHGCAACEIHTLRLRFNSSERSAHSCPSARSARVNPGLTCFRQGDERGFRTFTGTPPAQCERVPATRSGGSFADRRGPDPSQAEHFLAGSHGQAGTGIADLADRDRPTLASNERGILAGRTRAAQMLRAQSLQVVGHESRFATVLHSRQSHVSDGQFPAYRSRKR